MKPLLVEVAFDFICPWCLIGKRNLERALRALASSRPDVPVRLHWRGVQLLPHLPAEGVPFKEFYAQRLGSEAETEKLIGSTGEIGKSMTQLSMASCVTSSSNQTERKSRLSARLLTVTSSLVRR